MGNFSDFNLTRFEYLDLLHLIQRSLQPSELLPDSLPRPLVITFCILYITVIVLAVIGNIVVVVIITKYRTRRSVTDMYIVSVAIDDILIAVVNMPVQLYTVIATEWMATGTLGLVLCKLTNYIQGVTIVTCILTLTAIAVDRYIVVCMPAVAKALHSKKKALIGIAIVWMLSLCILSPQLVFMKLDRRLKISENEITFGVICAEFFPGGTKAARKESVVIYALFYCVPVLLMTLTYGTIVHRLWIQQPVIPAFNITRQQMKTLLHKKRITKWLIIMVGTFIVFWFPFFTFSLYCDFNVEQVTSYKTKMAVLRLIGYFNSCVNPVIYSFLNPNFQREFIRRWRLLFSL